MKLATIYYTTPTARQCMRAIVVWPAGGLMQGRILPTCEDTDRNMLVHLAHQALVREAPQYRASQDRKIFLKVSQSDFNDIIAAV